MSGRGKRPPFKRDAPFQYAKEEEASSSTGALQRIISSSRSSGALNLSNRQLQEVPVEVYQFDAEADNIKWWEINELVKLDLSHNELQQLPEQLCTLTALNTLLLSFNKLQQLPPGIASLEALKMLDVSDNPLTSLPDEVADLAALASLNCSNCKLQQLPDALGARQPNFSALNAAENQLSTLPAGLAASSSLVVLNVSKNQLSELPEAMMACWLSLKELDVSHNRIEVLPDGLGSLPRLAMLDVRSNALSALPSVLGRASNLVELKAGFNRINQLPSSLGMLINLKTLDVRNNLLQDLPDTLCGLQLVLLDLTNNSLSRLPPGLGFMTSLRSMPLDGNRLKLVRRDLWSGPISALLQHLRDQMPHPDSSNGTEPGSPLALHQQSGPGVASAVAAAAAAAIADKAAFGGGSAAGGELVLRGKGLTNIPAEVWQSAVGLSKLDLSLNSLAPGALDPAMLSTLSHLKVLFLNSCSLAAWPLTAVAPCSMESLHTLEFKANPLQGPLPRGGLACCPALRSLDFSGVKGLQLSPGLFSDTPQLEVLLAASAGLQEFPAAVLECCGLRQLQLNGNSISSLPVEVTQLTRLTELGLTNNQLTSLPPQMGLMSDHLRVLAVEGNCLRTIRRPILEKGTAGLLEWLKDRIPV